MPRKNGGRKRWPSTTADAKSSARDHLVETTPLLSHSLAPGALYSTASPLLLSRTKPDSG